MTKNLLFCFGLLAPSSLLAQTITSIANGNATNPFTWDCTCIPLPGNNIVINHDVTLDSDFAYSSGSVTINASGALTDTTTNRIFGVNGGTFTNHGLFTIYNLFHSGGTFTNNGNLTVTNGFAIGGTAHTVNNAELNVMDSLLVDVNAMLTTSNFLNATYTATAGTINNTGTFMGTDIWNSGTITSNTGPGMDIANLYTSGTINNGSELDISNDFWNSENVTNTNLIVVNNDLWNGDTIAGTAVFTNNGTISVAHDLNNSETMNGSGSWCVGNGSNNAGDVNGTLLFCDQTGDDFDNNFGTIASTVSFCTGGACMMGVNEKEENVSRVYPNPVSTALNIEMENSGTYQLVLCNALGETVGLQNFNGNRMQMDVSGLAPGMYLFRVSGNGTYTSGTVIKE